MKDYYEAKDISDATHAKQKSMKQLVLLLGMLDKIIPTVLEAAKHSPPESYDLYGEGDDAVVCWALHNDSSYLSGVSLWHLFLGEDGKIYSGGFGPEVGLDINSIDRTRPQEFLAHLGLLKSVVDTLGDNHDNNNIFSINSELIRKWRNEFRPISYC